jgi:site-specific recombinase XerD
MGDITLRKALDDYKTVYMPYRNFAERTREEYLNDLEDLVVFLDKSGINHVREIGLPIIERYVAHLEQEGFASLTRKRKVVTIRSFLSFLYQDGYIDANVAKSIVLPFAENKTPYFLTQTECDRVRNASADNPRDGAIIELLLQTGIKLSELICLTLTDIEIGETKETEKKNTGSIRILGGRGKKERVIPLNHKACLTLQKYLGIRKDAGSNVLFLNRFSKPLGERGVQKTLRKYLKKIGLQRASVHTLRHTFGIHHAVKGTSAKTIQEVMGHKDPRSTSIYFSIAKEIMKKELEEHAL